MKTFVVVTLAFLSVSAGAQTSTLETQNEQVVRRYIEAFNRGDAKAASAEFAEDATNFGRSVGREGFEERMEDIFATFPDWRWDIVDIITSEDKVVVRMNVTGTHLGVGKMRLNGMPVGAAATGKRFEITHMHWFTLRNGQIVDHQANRDDLGLLRQLGLLSLAATP